MPPRGASTLSLRTRRKRGRRPTECRFSRKAQPVTRVLPRTEAGSGADARATTASTPTPGCAVLFRHERAEVGSPRPLTLPSRLCGDAQGLVDLPAPGVRRDGVGLAQLGGP